MRATARILLAIAAIVAGALSLLSLFWWCVRTFSLLTGHGVADTVRELMFKGIAQVHATDQQLLLLQIREYFAVFGGIVGWTSLLALYILANRSFDALPKWILVGCLIGAAAAISMPGGGVYAFPPIIAAGALMVRSYIPKPNRTIERDAPPAARPSL